MTETSGDNALGPANALTQPSETSGPTAHAVREYHDNGWFLTLCGQLNPMLDYADAGAEASRCETCTSKAERVWVVDVAGTS